MVWSKRSPLLSKWLFPEVLPSLSLLPAWQQSAVHVLKNGQNAHNVPTVRSANAAAVMPKVSSVRHHKRERIMRITVDYEEVTHLRRVIMQSCGFCVCFMRMSPLEHAKRMQICLCIEAEAVAIVMDAVMWELPQAEFGLQRDEAVQ